jgi:hypothetical protein
MSSRPKAFKSESDLKKWFQKNAQKQTELWIHFKKGNKTGFTTQAALRLSICFGWTFVLIKRMDANFYKCRYVRRKSNSQWSETTVRIYKQCLRKKQVSAYGRQMYLERNKNDLNEKPAALSESLAKIFQSNLTAWEYFQSQNKGYKDFAIRWVMAPRNDQNKNARLNELIRDSENQIKLMKYLKLTGKINQNFQLGQTPIELARNLGPVCGAELRSLGLNTVEQLKNIGWEKVFYRWVERYPNRINLNALVALMAAVTEQDWRKIDPDLKSEARQIINQLRVGPSVR